jgi:hypothetical protein
MHRRLPRSTAVRGRLMTQTADRGRKYRNVLGVQNRLYRKDLGMTAERRHGPENHGLSSDRAILLWSSRAGAKAAAGCDKNGCSPLTFRHRTSMTGGRGLMGERGVWRTALITPSLQNRTFLDRHGKNAVLLQCTCNVAEIV